MSESSLFLRDDLARYWAQKDPFAELAALATTPVREVGRRKTFRFEVGGKGFYAKLHGGVGWWEIVKNWIVGKAPVVDASNEYRAATQLGQLGLHTLQVAAFGTRGRNPARRESFLVTDEIVKTVTLESYTLSWPDAPPQPRLKRVLIAKVAEVARVMHGAGINHRDFYLCHLLVEDPDLLALAGASPVLYLVDLHRAGRHTRIPRRWLVRDLAGLYYSTLDIDLTHRDRLLFLSCYFGLPIGDLLRRHARLLKTVERRAAKLYAKAERKHILPRQLAQKP